jgi:hypothetical protein
MKISLSETNLTTQIDPELQEFLELEAAIKYISNFLNTLQNDNSPVIDKSLFYNDYVNTLNADRDLKALSKASFSFIFKLFCVYFGYRTIPISTREHKKAIYLKRLHI